MKASRSGAVGPAGAVMGMAWALEGVRCGCHPCARDARPSMHREALMRHVGATGSSAITHACAAGQQSAVPHKPMSAGYQIKHLLCWTPPQHLKSGSI